MNQYVVTDIHVNHDELGKYCRRPNGYADLIHSAWVTTVKPDDIIFVLGDLYFGEKQHFVDYTRGLPGTKILIRGNHDLDPDDWYVGQCGFAVVVNQLTINGNVVLSHKPVNVNGLDAVNVHGHLHNISPERWLSEGGEDYGFLSEKNVNACPEVIGYAPVEINDLLVNRGGDEREQVHHLS